MPDFQHPLGIHVKFIIVHFYVFVYIVTIYFYQAFVF